MRWVVIALAVLGIAFGATMLVGSNERPPPADDDPPEGIAWLDTGGRGAPRLVESEIRFPRDASDSMGLAVPEACGTPARLATVSITGGASVRVAYQCEAQPRERNCSGPASLCSQVLCLVASESARGLSGCARNREFVGEANLSIGPERGRLVIVPPLNAVAAVTLR
jgi:hypothetical protein